MNDAHIELVIDTLVLDGVAPQQRERFRAEVEGALQALLEARGLPPSLSGADSLTRLHAAPQTLPATDGAAPRPAAVAAAIYGALRP